MKELLNQIMAEFNKYKNADYADDDATDRFIDYMYEAYEIYQKNIDK